MQWFNVDKRGLGKLLERKGKQFILYELVQNAWDENTTRVDIALKRLKAGDNLAYLEVRDDNPTGFSDLSYAFTLFAESEKKSNAEKRGRFNLGEKLVLALCEEATIMSTKGTVIFCSEGRKTSDQKTPAGTVFSAKLRLSQAELNEFEEAANRLLPPGNIATYFNGKLIEPRLAVKNIHGVTLPTELSNGDGVLRSTTRKTVVELFEPRIGESPMIYEMGIPVVETEGRWHIDISQKVPLNMDRDNVTPAYLGQLRAIVAEYMINDLTTEDANSAWVRDAMTRHGDKMPTETVERLTELRFGAKRVIYDPTDLEANARAVAAGYTVVHGGSMNKAEWEAAKRAGAILPAGKVTPSPKPFKPDGSALKMLPVDRWTDAIKAYAQYAARIGERLTGCPMRIKVANDVNWHFVGCYGRGELTVNVARVGYDWFEGALSGKLTAINDFLIHEFGHHYCGNHLDEAYYDALTMLGGKLTQLALDEPKLFKPDRSLSQTQTADSQPMSTALPASS